MFNIKFKLKALSISFFIFLVIPISAMSETIKVVSFPLTRLVESHEKGVFVERLRRLSKAAELDIELSIVPVARASRFFRMGEYDIFFPAIPSRFPDTQKVLFLPEPVFSRKDYIFTRKGSKPLSTFRSLENRTVAITLNFSYAKELFEVPGIEFVKGNSDKAAAKLLLTGRADAYVVEINSALSAFRSLNALEKVQYTPEKPCHEQKGSYLFHNTKRGQRLQKQLSAAMAKLQ